MDYENYKKVTYHWGASVKIMTSVIFLLLFFTGVGLAYPHWGLGGIIVILIVLLPFFICLLYLPLYLQFTKYELIIKRVKGKIIIPLSDIKAINSIDKKQISSAVRLWGSGGLFGYLGIFSNQRFGRFKMYTTELSHLYMIVTETKKIVVSCRDEKLISEICTLLNES